MRTRTISSVLCGLATLVSAQNKAAIEKKLTSDYALTQPTADQSDIVTAGSILVLKLGNIVMGPAYQSNMYKSTYKDGKISPDLAGKMSNFSTRMSRVPGSTAAPPNTRTFVPGEKMWVTKIDCKDDGVYFDLFTDAYGDMRYKALLKFHFEKKGAMPSADQMSKMVAEVFKVQADDQQAAPTGGGQQQAAPRQQQQQQQAPPPAPETPLAPIPPPPPPADDAPPKTISLGQTTDQVVANLGQPEKVVKLGTKEIYYYKDLKVTFVSGKVSDVQ